MARVISVHPVMLASVAGRRGYLDFQPTANRADVHGQKVREVLKVFRSDAFDFFIETTTSRGGNDVVG